MATVGLVALVVLALLVVIGLVVLAISLPSMARYSKIRKM
jgi:hypothetical protein